MVDIAWKRGNYAVTSNSNADRCVRFKYLLGCHNLNSYIGSWIEKLLKLISLNNKLQILRIYFSIYFRSCYTIIEYINVQYLVWWSRIIFWSKKASSRENIMTSSNLPLCVNKRVSPHTRKASIFFYFFFCQILEIVLNLSFTGTPFAWWINAFSS